MGKERERKDSAEILSMRKPLLGDKSRSEGRRTEGSILTFALSKL